MTTNISTSQDLSALRRENGKTCISIIVPTHRLSADRQTDKVKVDHAIAKAREILSFNYPEAEVKALLESIDELHREIDFTHNMEGLGLYVSQGIKQRVHFPFPVQEKILVSDHFELRELMYLNSYAIPYLILELNEQGARLFTGSGHNISEVKESPFPIAFSDDYTYSKPAHTSSFAGYGQVKNFEKDKSEMESIRQKDFFREVDKALNVFLISDMPLIVMGVEKALSLFSGVSAHTKKIAGKIPGTYSHFNEKKIADAAWPVMQQYFDNREKALLKEFEEKTGEGLGIAGIQNVWSAALEGKGLRLLVEKDYMRPAFLGEDEKHLYLRPRRKTKKVLPDAVDVVIETVLEKNGQVHFVDNGMLKDHQQIAMITRY